MGSGVVFGGMFVVDLVMAGTSLPATPHGTGLFLIKGANELAFQLRLAPWDSRP
ncbi:hypothetical protein BOTBODRAFT_56380 [Botryobasidium botryosum FD-172 SS1]|uniref:Uncharacterized protein n=1 Tax=Botryobasidium botryosum (strain FD-172 SS1) TaxID=930990 RepID=A0A067MNC3_BOTB1|nr:hypothetical protein BOTBODRAFT_56380 [Botryobasidium botryosum FD-172 SS1]